MGKNIAITGEGIVSAIGTDKASVLNSLLHGNTGIGTMSHLQSVHKELPVGEVKLSNEEMAHALGLEPSPYHSRTALMGMMAVKEALADAGISGLDDHDRVVLVSGTTVGGMDVTERFYASMRADGSAMEALDGHTPGDDTDRIASHFGIFSDATTISTACSSAANAIALGARLIENGDATIVVAGGSEALTLFHLNGFNSLMILDHEPCRPFDDTRCGLNLGEGAAFVVMESMSHAKKREAKAHAYLSGYGIACDAYHQTATSENGEGAYLAMTQALEVADINADAISYVNAHGTGTPNNDQSESVALRRVFGGKMPPVSSTKSFTGHPTSASGSIESVISILALQHSFIPANLGWHNPMPDGITPSLGENKMLEHVMCNSFGFGGNDTSLIFSREAMPVSFLIDPLRRPVKVVAEVEITTEEQLAEIKNYVKPLEARRMGRLMKSSLLASYKVLEKAGVSCPDAIITGTSLGCLENSEKLLDALADEGEETMSPTLFMQSTHNTIGSNIAIRLKCHGYNLTYSHNAESLRWALHDAEMLISTGVVNTVLVGMHDESTPFYQQCKEVAGQPVPPTIHSKAIILSCGD